MTSWMVDLEQLEGFLYKQISTMVWSTHCTSLNHKLFGRNKRWQFCKKCAQGWEFWLFAAKLLKFGRFHKWFYLKYFVRPFLSSFDNLA